MNSGRVKFRIIFLIKGIKQKVNPTYKDSPKVFSKPVFVDLESKPMWKGPSSYRSLFSNLKNVMI